MLNGNHHNNKIISLGIIWVIMIMKEMVDGEIGKENKVRMNKNGNIGDYHKIEFDLFKYYSINLLKVRF